MTELEQWVPVVGFHKYMVSDWGRVRSRETGLMIQPYRAPGGIMLITLKDSLNQSVVKKLARLVCDAFQYNPEGYAQVLYKDGDRTNCRLSNLIFAGDPDKPAPRKKYGKEKQKAEQKAAKIRKPASESLYKGLETPETPEVAPEPEPVPEAVRKDPRAAQSHTPSERKFMSSRRINFKRPVYIVETGEQFESVAALCRKYALDHSTVHKMLRGISRQKTHRNMTFGFVDEKPPEQVYNRSVDNALPNRPGRRPVRVVGSVEVYDSQADLARALDLNQSLVSRVLRGVTKRHKGMQFEYVED